MANVLGNLFQDIADSIRAKTGDTATMKPADFPSKIAAIEAGGGGGVEDDRVKYVTFMDGGGADIITLRELTFANGDGGRTSFSNISVANGDYNIMAITSLINFNDKCYVYFDGEIYEVERRSIGEEVFYWGNYSLADSTATDTGEPFLIQIISDPSVIYLYAKETSAVTEPKHTIGIYKKMVELYKQPVVMGDTVHDPVTKGYIEAPTKEQTESKVYTYNGWTLTNGGSASASALQNVTEDRVVYAAFSEAARKYTITFSDEDGTLLNSQTLAYGAMPSYTAEKDGYLLVGWSPELSEVTGDANYTAVWRESVAFAAASWEKIVEKANDGTAAEDWAVGDTKDLVLNYADGTSETVTVKIVGFNAGDSSLMTDGQPYKIAFRTTHALATLRPFATDNNFQKVSFTAEKYENLSLVKYLNNDIFNALPSALRENIRERRFKFGGYDTSHKSNLKVWGINRQDINVMGIGSGYIPCFDYSDSKIMKQGKTGTAVEWYFGSLGDKSSFYYASGVNASGNFIKVGSYDEYISDGTTPRGVVFGFCI